MYWVRKWIRPRSESFCKGNSINPYYGKFGKTKVLNSGLKIGKSEILPRFLCVEISVQELCRFSQNEVSLNSGDSFGEFSVGQSF